MDAINDPVFGDLQFDGYWTREIEVRFLGELSLVQLIVEGNAADESIVEEQRASYRRLSTAIEHAEREILRHYHRIRGDNRSRLGEDADARLPTVSDVSQLSRMVTLTGVVFPMVTVRGEMSVGFLLECSWDPEHGLGVRLTNDQIEVGTQDILT